MGWSTAVDSDRLAEVLNGRDVSYGFTLNTNDDQFTTSQGNY